MDQIRIESDRQTLTFDPSLGGRMTSWLVDGLEVLTGVGSHPVEHGMYPMAPWAGRLRENRITAEQLIAIGRMQAKPFEPEINYQTWAMHGTVLTAPVDTMQRAAPGVVMFRHRMPEWSATLTAHWSVAGLTTRSILTMEADAPAPALLGWHPWFKSEVCGLIAQWSLQGELAPREESLPSGELMPWQPVSARVDDAFHVPDGRVEVSWGNLKLSIENSDPWFVIYDQRDDAVCIEPQTGPPNAFERPIIGAPPAAQPGSPRSMSTIWEWTLAN